MDSWSSFEGTLHASSNTMARTFRELVVWQLAFELNEKVGLLLRQSGQAARDFRFRDQLRDSVRSIPANIAEGFGRYSPAEIARFTDIARASLDETENHLRDGVVSGYFTTEAVAPLILLSARCRTALSHWHTYLRRVRNEPRFKRR
jgi:four helix bundle protein